MRTLKPHCEEFDWSQVSFRHTDTLISQFWDCWSLLAAVLTWLPPYPVGTRKNPKSPQGRVLSLLPPGISPSPTVGDSKECAGYFAGSDLRDFMLDFWFRICRSELHHFHLIPPFSPPQLPRCCFCCPAVISRGCHLLLLLALGPALVFPTLRVPKTYGGKAQCRH